MSTTPSSNTSARKPGSSVGTGTSAGHVAHHVAEFGEVDNLVHISHEDEHAMEAVPAPPVSRKDKLAMKERVHRLGRRLFASRHLMQYFHDDVLYRTEGNRSIGPDELFLDLVIVGGIAALGHELRETFNGWDDVEKFFNDAFFDNFNKMIATELFEFDLAGDRSIIPLPIRRATQSVHLRKKHRTMNRQIATPSSDRMNARLHPDNMAQQKTNVPLSGNTIDL